MKISKILIPVQTLIYKQKKYLQEKSMRKYFDISNLNPENNHSYIQIYNARHGIANFAKSNKIQIKLSNTASTSINTPTGVVNIFVRNLKNKGKAITDVISSDITKTYPKVMKRTLILPIQGEDIEIARQVQSSTEDSFLRHFYRTVEELKDIVKKI